MTLISALGALAACVSIAFALCTADRWVSRRRPHELAWTESLVMFALASGAYWWAGAVGWNEWNFKAFYLFGAILNVPFLALGTVYLLGGEARGRAVRRVLLALSWFCAGVVLATPLRAPIPTEGMPEGKEIFGVGPRIMAAVGSGVGATVLIVGAAWSAFRLLRSQRRPAAGAAPAISPRRLAATNVLIALGSIILSLGGTFFTGNEVEVGFGIMLVAGIVVLFGGFLVSTPSPSRGPAPSRPA